MSPDRSVIADGQRFHAAAQQLGIEPPGDQLVVLAPSDHGQTRTDNPGDIAAENVQSSPVDIDDFAFIIEFDHSF